MKEIEIKRLLKEGAGGLGVVLGEEALGQFLVYLEELKVWSRRINLTSITSDEEIIYRHFLDSLTPYGFLKGFECKRLLDVGSGAGFPGIPLKIADPALSVVLLDSVEKKVRFMRHIIRTLGLSIGGGAEAIAVRADDPKTIQRFGEGFDCVISRAFSSLEDFIEIGRPFCRSGGYLVAMKGPAVHGEIEGLKKAGGAVGAGLRGLFGPEITEVEVPGGGRGTTLVTFKKV